MGRATAPPWLAKPESGPAPPVESATALMSEEVKRKMRRAQLLLACLCLSVSYLAQAETPGFQGTINNYGVGMNPDPGCRNPSNGQPACSQWFRFRFQAFNDGTVQAPFTITNDSLNDFCGAVVFVVKDHPNGRILGTFQSPRYCIKGKGADTNYHERRAEEVWTFKTDPAVGQQGGDLYGYPVDYEQGSINWDGLLPSGVGDAVKVAGAIINGIAAE